VSSPRLCASGIGSLHPNRVQEIAKSRPDLEDLLAKPIKDLGLQIAGSPLERFVNQLYRELEQKKLLKFNPACYLSDEWGCPSGEPVIGIPFIWRICNWPNWKRKSTISRMRAKS